jgi:hypothetical protein
MNPVFLSFRLFNTRTAKTEADKCTKLQRVPHTARLHPLPNIPR